MSEDDLTPMMEGKRVKLLGKFWLDQKNLYMKQKHKHFLKDLLLDQKNPLEELL